jgi:hypothetical protein
VSAFVKAQQDEMRAERVELQAELKAERAACAEARLQQQIAELIAQLAPTPAPEVVSEAQLAALQARLGGHYHFKLPLTAIAAGCRSSRP